MYMTMRRLRHIAAAIVATTLVGTAVPASALALRGAASATIDTQPPSIQLSFPAPAEDQLFYEYVNAVVKDEESGVASKVFSFDGGVSTAFSGDSLPLPNLGQLEPGDYVLEVVAVDGAGNVGVATLSVPVVRFLCHPEPFCTRPKPPTPSKSKEKTRVGKLKIKRKGRKITVRGTITKGVTGNVRITAKFYGKKPRSKKLRKKIKKTTKAYARIKKRRFRKTITVPTRGRYKIVAKFRGNGSFKASKRTRRIKVK